MGEKKLICTMLVIVLSRTHMCVNIHETVLEGFSRGKDTWGGGEGKSQSPCNCFIK